MLMRWSEEPTIGLEGWNSQSHPLDLPEGTGAGGGINRLMPLIAPIMPIY